MLTRWYNRRFGPIEWPRVLVGWCTVDIDAGREAAVKTIAGSFMVSTQLLGYASSAAPLAGLYRRWPSLDELIMHDLLATFVNGAVYGIPTKEEK